MGIPDLSPEKAVCRSRSSSYKWAGTTNWFKLGKEYVKAVCYHPAYLTSMQSTLWEMLNITSWNQDCQENYHLQICRWYYPSGRKWRGTKESLDEGERREGKSWLKTQYSKREDHGIWSHHFMANRRGNNGNSEKLYFRGSKITADGDCSHEIKRRLLLGRKAMTNLDSILTSREAETLLWQQTSV